MNAHDWSEGGDPPSSPPTSVKAQRFLSNSFSFSILRHHNLANLQTTPPSGLLWKTFSCAATISNDVRLKEPVVNCGACHCRLQPHPPPEPTRLLCWASLLETVRETTTDTRDSLAEPLPLDSKCRRLLPLRRPSMTGSAGYGRRSPQKGMPIFSSARSASIPYFPIPQYHPRLHDDCFINGNLS